MKDCVPIKNPEHSKKYVCTCTHTHTHMNASTPHSITGGKFGINCLKSLIGNRPFDEILGSTPLIFKSERMYIFISEVVCHNHTFCSLVNSYHCVYLYMGDILYKAFQLSFLIQTLQLRIIFFHYFSNGSFSFSLFIQEITTRWILALLELYSVLFFFQVF